MGERRADGVRAIGIRGQVATAMDGADLEPRIAIQRSFENEMGQGDGGFQRISDGVGENPAAGQPAAIFQFRGSLRVHEDQQVEFFALGPHGMEFFFGKFMPFDGTTDTYAAQPERDSIFNLFNRQIGMLQSDGGESDEAIGRGGANFNQRYVLNFDQSK